MAAMNLRRRCLTERGGGFSHAPAVDEVGRNRNAQMRGDGSVARLRGAADERRTRTA